MAYVDNHATAQDTTKLLDTMSIGQLQALKASIEVEKLTSTVFGRQYNQRLLAHVLRKLKRKELHNYGKVYSYSY